MLFLALLLACTPVPVEDLSECWNEGYLDCEAYVAPRPYGSSDCETEYTSGYCTCEGDYDDFVYCGN